MEPTCSKEAALVALGRELNTSAVLVMEYADEVKLLEIKGVARFPNMAPEPSRSPPTRSSSLHPFFLCRKYRTFVLEFRPGRILR